MAEFEKVAKASEIAPGKGLTVSVSGCAVALFNVGGVFYALENSCRHRGGPLGDGTVISSGVLCPWHLWEYDIVSGACRNNPDARVGTYPVRVEGDDVLVGTVQNAPPA